MYFSCSCASRANFHQSRWNLNRSRPAALFLSAPASAELPYAPDGFDLDYGTFGTAVEMTIAGYREAGYGAGMRVGLLLENRPEFFRHWMALNALGISIVPINPDLKPDEIAFQLDASKHQYQCFLQTYAQGAPPTVPTDTGPCP